MKRKTPNELAVDYCDKIRLRPVIVRFDCGTPLTSSELRQYNHGRIDGYYDGSLLGFIAGFKASARRRRK